MMSLLLVALKTYLYQGKEHLIIFCSFFIHLHFVYVKYNSYKNQPVTETNLCIHLSYLEDQRNLKINNKNKKKKNV